MQQKASELLEVFDFGDLSFFYLIAKKNFKFLLITSLFVSMIVFFISLNMEKRYLSEATIVIAPEDNKIVNIDINTNVNNENFCLVLFLRKADRIAIIKSSLLEAIGLNIQST